MILFPTVVVKPGISVTLTFPSTIPVPDFGREIAFTVSDDLTSRVGNEQVVLVFGTTSIAIVDRHDRMYVTSQMLFQPRRDGNRLVSGVYRARLGVNGTTPSLPTFETLSGFRPRRTVINTVAVQTP